MAEGLGAHDRISGATNTPCAAAAYTRKYDQREIYSVDSGKSSRNRQIGITVIVPRLVSMRSPNDRQFYSNLDGGQVGVIGGPSHQAQLATVRGLVAENPARVAQVVKHWVSKDE